MSPCKVLFTSDSLLMLHGGSDTEDGTYGKSDDDELENIMAIKTNKSELL